AVGPSRLRFVTHLDVDRAGCERAIQVFADVMERLRGARATPPRQSLAPRERHGGIDPAQPFDALVARYRATLPLVHELVYLDSAGLAPISSDVIDAIDANLRLRATAGKVGVKGVIEQTYQ